MRDGAGDLERELAAREKEMTGTHAASSGTDFDPDSLAQRFKVRCSLPLRFLNILSHEHACARDLGTVRDN